MANSFFMVRKLTGQKEPATLRKKKKRNKGRNKEKE